VGRFRRLFEVKRMVASRGPMKEAEGEIEGKDGYDVVSRESSSKIS